jgi:predicted secreted protein
MRFVLSILGALLLAGCETTGGPAARITLDPSHHDRVIRAEQGQLIEVRLPSAPPGTDPTSGNPRWDIDRLDAPPLALVEPPRFEPATDARPGTQGVTIFVFRAATPGRAMVRLVYRHPWEQAVKGETFLAWIHVR